MPYNTRSFHIIFIIFKRKDRQRIGWMESCIDVNKYFKKSPLLPYMINTIL